MYKIFYDNGSTYTGDPYFAPVFGVLVIVEDDENHGRKLIQNADYYCWDDRGNGFEWFEADFVGMIDYLSTPGPKRVLIGRLVSNKLQQEVFDRAYADLDFLPKTGWQDRHRRKS